MKYPTLFVAAAVLMALSACQKKEVVVADPPTRDEPSTTPVQPGHNQP